MPKKRRIKKSKPNILHLLIIVFLAVFSLFIVFQNEEAKKFISYGSQLPDNFNFTPAPAKPVLQLYNFPVVTPTPRSGVVVYPTIALVPDKNSTAPEGCGIAHPISIKGTENGKCCVQDGPVNNPSECCTGVPYCDLTQNPPVGSPGITCSCGGNAGGVNNQTGGNQQVFSGTCGQYPYWCNAKPVIYLYPESRLIASVKVEVPGRIYISIPEYPENGWENVEAYPDGTLYYKGKKYRELFYESEITPIDPPENGIVIEKKDLRAALEDLTAKLGLNEFEQNEFMAYWLPSLKELDTRYIHISIFNQSQKDIIDKVFIHPKPQTFIQFIMYFKGLNEFRKIDPLKLPETPKRIGFTAVEWGGILDK